MRKIINLKTLLKKMREALVFAAAYDGVYDGVIEYNKNKPTTDQKSKMGRVDKIIEQITPSNPLLNLCSQIGVLFTIIGLALSIRYRIVWIFGMLALMLGIICMIIGLHKVVQGVRQISCEDENDQDV